jgi:hypothetical protein
LPDGLDCALDDPLQKVLQPLQLGAAGWTTVTISSSSHDLLL